MIKIRMRKSVSKIALAATFGLALTLTIASCGASRIQHLTEAEKAELSNVKSVICSSGGTAEFKGEDCCFNGGHICCNAKGDKSRISCCPIERAYMCFKDQEGVATVAPEKSSLVDASGVVSDPATLVGKWVGVFGDGIDWRALGATGEILELSDNGNGILTDSYGEAFWSSIIKWKTEDGHFYITNSNGETGTDTEIGTYSYKIQSSLLTFTSEKGKITEFTKCHKDCKQAAKEYDKAKAEKIAATIKAKAEGGSYTDSRDGKTYKTVKFDNQTWMAENLNYNAEGSKCNNNDLVNCQKYGRLYDWATAKSACPDGWHLPSDVEWQTLVDFAGGDGIAGKMLKASYDWANDDSMDAIGFSALPGGEEVNGNFRGIGGSGLWWSSTEAPAGAYNLAMIHYGMANIVKMVMYKTHLYSVRCIKN